LQQMRVGLCVGSGQQCYSATVLLGCSSQWWYTAVLKSHCTCYRCLGVGAHVQEHSDARLQSSVQSNPKCCCAETTLYKHTPLTFV
jgi:hypothetical protein